MNMELKIDISNELNLFPEHFYIVEGIDTDVNYQINDGYIKFNIEGLEDVSKLESDIMLIKLIVNNFLEEDKDGYGYEPLDQGQAYADGIKSNLSYNDYR